MDSKKPFMPTDTHDVLMRKRDGRVICSLIPRDHDWLIRHDSTCHAAMWHGGAWVDIEQQEMGDVENCDAMPGTKGQVMVHDGEKWRLPSFTLTGEVSFDSEPHPSEDNPKEGCVAYYKEGKWIRLPSRSHLDQDSSPSSNDWEDYDLEDLTSFGIVTVRRVRLRRVTDA